MCTTTLQRLLSENKVVDSQIILVHLCTMELRCLYLYRKLWRIEENKPTSTSGKLPQTSHLRCKATRSEMRPATSVAWQNSINKNVFSTFQGNCFTQHVPYMFTSFFVAFNYVYIVTYVQLYFQHKQKPLVVVALMLWLHDSFGGICLKPTRPNMSMSLREHVHWPAWCNDEWMICDQVVSGKHRPYWFSSHSVAYDIL